MAKAQPRKPASSSGRFNKFINISLTVEQKKDLAQSEPLVAFPLELLFDLVEEGFKVSLSEDKRNNSYRCSLTDGREGSPHEGFTMSGRGRYPAAAWASVCYRHYVICQQDWSTFQESDEGSGSDFD